jgi:hypothetical protein
LSLVLVTPATAQWTADDVAITAVLADDEVDGTEGNLVAPFVHANQAKAYVGSSSAQGQHSPTNGNFAGKFGRTYTKTGGSSLTVRLTLGFFMTADAYGGGAPGTGSGYGYGAADIQSNTIGTLSWAFAVDASATGWITGGDWWINSGFVEEEIHNTLEVEARLRSWSEASSSGPGDGSGYGEAWGLWSNP